MLGGEGGQKLVRGDAFKIQEIAAGPPLRLPAEGFPRESELRAHFLPLCAGGAELQRPEDGEGAEEPVERRPAPGAGPKLLKQRIAQRQNHGKNHVSLTRAARSATLAAGTEQVPSFQDIRICSDEWRESTPTIPASG